MTTGSKIIDFQVLTPLDCGSTKVGYKSIKTWSGADDTTPYVKQPSPPPFAYYAWETDRRGNTRRVIRYHRGTPVAPPKRARGRGEHAYSMTFTEALEPQIGWKLLSNPVKQGTVASCFGGASFTGPDWTANDTIKLVQKLRSVVNGSDVDMSVVLGTSHQATDIIISAAERIGSAARHVRRGQVGKAAQDLMGNTHRHARVSNGTSPKAVSAAWLELQYGWLPLLSDVKSAAEFIAHQLAYPATKVYRVRRKLDVQIGSSPNIAFTSAYRLQYGQIIAKISEKPTFWKTLGLLDPENVAWELLPWSFVVDWFIPIGAYLQARSFSSGLQGTFITSRYDYTLVRGCITKPGSNYVITNGSNYLSKLVELTRTVSTSLSVPMPRFKPLSSVPSWTRAANAVGLLGQHFGR